MDKVIKVGLAGYGRSGRDIHRLAISKDPRFQIVGVADALEDRRAEAAEECKCPVYNDYRELLAAGGFDLFVNATPSLYHVEGTLTGLKNYMVLSEKPSATTVAEFDAILEAAKSSGHAFFPFQNSRFYLHAQKIKEIIASGVLGKIINIRLNWSGFGRRWDWQTRQEMKGGNLFNTGPHPLDLAIDFFGEGTPKVFARMKAEHAGLGGDADNYASVVIYGNDKPDIEIVTSSFLAYPQGDQINVQGTCGGITARPGSVKWKYFDPATAPKHPFWKPWSEQRKYCSEQLNWQECEWQNAIEQQNGFNDIASRYYDSLYNVIVNGKERVVKLDQVRRQIYVNEQAHLQNPLPQFPLP